MSRALRSLGALLVAATLVSAQAPIEASVTPLGPGCGAPPPTITATPPVVGGKVFINLTTDFPNAHSWVFASFGPVTPYLDPLCGCVVYVDVLDFQANGAYPAGNWIEVWDGYTNSEGEAIAVLEIPNDPGLIGTELIVQARSWALGGCYEGGDHLSNGIQLNYGEVGPGSQGLTPGYWKQRHHFCHWAAPYTPTTLFSEVFEDVFPGMTLRDVLAQGGGGLNALGRHAVSALLNAASAGVDYELEVAQVIALFNSAVPGSAEDAESLKNYFAGFNELEGVGLGPCRGGGESTGGCNGGGNSGHGGGNRGHGGGHGRGGNGRGR